MKKTSNPFGGVDVDNRMEVALTTRSIRERIRVAKQMLDFMDGEWTYEECRRYIDGLSTDDMIDFSVQMRFESSAPDFERSLVAKTGR